MTNSRRESSGDDLEGVRGRAVVGADRLAIVCANHSVRKGRRIEVDNIAGAAKRDVVRVQRHGACKREEPAEGACAGTQGDVVVRDEVSQKRAIWAEDG